ncbi:hypothetical protein [Methylobacterium sp. E-045]|uniref:hypothetical protein n=1 Tax=Methylobacterium sp. E-045 TaxID=2836575 RepID=UPI001FBB1E52|nr:hypothetical protein [Methylobacterium sp. E-045]MCJ2132299.1 hypothetical protein [Methylobacterium sp. E-045]
MNFDPQRRASSLEMKKAVSSVVAAVECFQTVHHPRIRGRGAARQDRFIAAIEALVCNLAGLSLDPRSRPLAVPRSNKAMWPSNGFVSPIYGQHFRDALEFMEAPELGLIEPVGKGFSYQGNAWKLSTVRPTTALYNLLPREPTTWDAFRRIPAEHVLLRRKRKVAGAQRGELDDYADTDYSAGLRHEVERINAWLADAAFWLLPDGSSHGLATSGQPCDPTRRSLRRIFANGRWDQGGRLYGGFWMTMPREDRFKRLRIASKQSPHGEPVANVDFRQFNLRAAYGLTNQPVPSGDLYDVRGDGAFRDGFKVLMNAMFYVPSRLTRLPAEAQVAFPSGTKARDAVAEVERFHAPIAHLFGTEVGFRLTAIESTILVTALAILFNKGITALPLHDAVLVAESEAALAADAMEEASEFFSPEFGARPSIEFYRASTDT